MTMKKRILIIAASVCVLLSLTLLFGFTTEPAATQTAYAATVDDGAEPQKQSMKRITPLFSAGSGNG